MILGGWAASLDHQYLASYYYDLGVVSIPLASDGHLFDLVSNVVKLTV